MLHDPLSDVLQLVQATSVISTGLKASGDWAVSVDSHSGFKFNAIMEGSCLLSVDGEDTVDLTAGDCFLLTKGLPFVIASGDNQAPRPAREVFAGATGHLANFDGGPGKPFLCLGGRMGTTSDFDFLSSSLPPVVILRAAGMEAERVRWLLGRLVEEFDEGQPGAGVMANQIMHMIFIEMIRYCKTLCPNDTNWLAAISDRRIRPALEMMHGQAKNALRLDDLASACNLSRSQFSSRFVALVGIAPMDYFLRWRMQLAKRALAAPGCRVAQIAADFGYQSEAAFGAAFKRIHGVSPRRAVALPHADH